MGRTLFVLSNDEYTRAFETMRLAFRHLQLDCAGNEERPFGFLVFISKMKLCLSICKLEA